MLTGKRCSFCSRELKQGYGIMLVRIDGSIEYYCSSKCRKNALHLKRDPRKLKWVTKRKGSKP
ncbi:MAG: 50S ribosomal protein L24e [Nitrososphaerales archaeon]